MQICYYTHCGLAHPQNEDGIFIKGFEFTGTKQPQSVFLPEREGLFAVWDGLGGHPGGQTATAIALRGMASITPPELPNCETISNILWDIVKDMRARVVIDPELLGMGASCAGLWLCGDYALVFNCGDCRVYQKKSMDLKKLSYDHSRAQDLFDKGFIDVEGMRMHPDRHKLNSAICGSPHIPNIFCDRIKLKEKDAFLVCSDGLWEALSHDELEDILDFSPEKAAERLTEAYVGSITHDDYSFIIIQC